MADKSAAVIENFKPYLIPLLFGVLVVLQFLNWRAVVQVEEAVDFVRTSAASQSCGARNDPCYVVVRQ